MLMAVGETPLAANENGDFLAFYQRFATDSLYQRSHVADPVEFRTYDSETFEEISGVVDVDQWFAFRPDLFSFACSVAPARRRRPGKRFPLTGG